MEARLGIYLVRRFFLMVLTLFGISVLVFVMLRLVPGNIADIVFNAAGMIDVAEKAKLEKELGLDQPIVVQYAQWISGLAHGDLGYSLCLGKTRAAGDRSSYSDHRQVSRIGAYFRSDIRCAVRCNQRRQAEHSA